MRDRTAPLFVEILAKMRVLLSKLRRLVCDFATLYFRQCFINPFYLILPLVVEDIDDFEIPKEFIGDVPGTSCLTIKRDGQLRTFICWSWQFFW